MILKGNKWNLNSQDPKEQYAALKALQTQLLLAVQDDGLLSVKMREPDQHSKVVCRSTATERPTGATCSGSSPRPRTTRS